MNLLRTAVLISSLMVTFSIAEALTTLTPEQFGASVENADNTTAFQAMITAATSSAKPVEILLARDAVYRLSGLPGRPYALMIRNAKDLVFNGQNATLLITSPLVGGIRTEDCRDIELKNFSIDYDPLPYTQGTITAVDTGEYWFELKIDAGHLELDAPNFRDAIDLNSLTVRSRPDGGLQYGPTILRAERTESKGDGLWRVYPHKQSGGYDDPLVSGGIRVGDRLVYTSRNYEQAVSASNCENILWENITVYASPGLSFYPQSNRGQVIRNCHVAVKDGRMFSANADGIHLRGSRGDVLIEGCTFSGMGDDAINVHSSAIAVLRQTAPNQLLVRKHTYSVLKGDVIRGIDAQTANPIGDAMVTSVEDKGWELLITFDRDFTLPALPEGTSPELNEHGHQTAMVNLYNLSESASPFTIRNCEFNDFRGRGILVSGRDGIIENNTFKVREGWGIVMHYEASRWAEGPPAENITIRKNRFHNVNNASMPAIYSSVVTGTGAQPPADFFRKITIEGNSFTGWKDPIAIRSAENLKVRNNRIIKK